MTTIESRGRRLRACLRGAVVALALLASGAEAGAGGDWNDGAIAWKALEAGLAEAASADRPVCLVFYTDWCPTAPATAASSTTAPWSNRRRSS